MINRKELEWKLIKGNFLAKLEAVKDPGFIFMYDVDVQTAQSIYQIICHVPYKWKGIFSDQVSDYFIVLLV